MYNTQTHTNFPIYLYLLFRINTNIIMCVREREREYVLKFYIERKDNDKFFFFFSPHFLILLFKSGERKKWMNFMMIKGFESTSGVIKIGNKNDNSIKFDSRVENYPIEHHENFFFI